MRNEKKKETQLNKYLNISPYFTRINCQFQQKYFPCDTTDIYLSWGYYYGVIILQTRTEKTNTLALAFQKYHTLFFIFRESWYSLKNASCMTCYDWTKSSIHVSLLCWKQTFIISHWLFSMIPWVVLSQVLFC